MEAAGYADPSEEQLSTLRRALEVDLTDLHGHTRTASILPARLGARLRRIAMEDDLGTADASRQERQGALAAQGGGWGGSFPAANFSGDDGGGGGGVSSLTADFQRGMDFSGSGDAPTPSAADPFAYVGSSSGQPTTAAQPVTGTPAQRAAQQGVPRLEHVLQEAIEDPRNKTQLLRYEQDVQKFLRDQSCVSRCLPALAGSTQRLALKGRGRAPAGAGLSGSPSRRWAATTGSWCTAWRSTTAWSTRLKRASGALTKAWT